MKYPIHYFFLTYLLISFASSLAMEQPVTAASHRETNADVSTHNYDNKATWQIDNGSEESSSIGSSSDEEGSVNVTQEQRQIQKAKLKAEIDHLRALAKRQAKLVNVATHENNRDKLITAAKKYAELHVQLAVRGMVLPNIVQAVEIVEEKRKKCLESVAQVAEIFQHADPEFGFTMLHTAAWEGYVDAIKILVNDEQANVDIQDAYGFTPLHKAALRGNVAVIAALIKKYRANVEAGDAIEETPLFHAVSSAQCEAINALIEKYQANVNAQCATGATPLHEAAIHGNVDVMNRLVLRHKARLDTTTSAGLTPLDTALVRGEGDILEVACAFLSLGAHLSDESMDWADTERPDIAHILRDCCKKKLL